MSSPPTLTPTETVVLHVGRQSRATEKAVVESVHVRVPGVVAVDANPVAQTATVRYDPSVTSVQALRRAAERCGFECAGGNVPGCLCDPLHEPARPEHAHDGGEVGRAHAPDGHGEGGHAGHSMDQMARQMRNRFVLALVFTLAILASSSVGRSVFGRAPTTPGGLDREVWQLLLSLPVLWAARMFFTGAVVALRQRTLDMNVLVAVAIGVSWVGVGLANALKERAVVMWRMHADVMPDEAAAMTVRVLADLHDAAGQAGVHGP